MLDRIDVLAHRDDDLAAVRLQRRGAVQAAPDFGARRAGGELQEDHRPQIGQPLVHDDAADALDAELRASDARGTAARRPPS